MIKLDLSTSFIDADFLDAYNRNMDKIKDANSKLKSPIDFSTLPLDLAELVNEAEDPSPYCTWCGANTPKNCKCPPRAEND